MNDDHETFGKWHFVDGNCKTYQSVPRPSVSEFREDHVQRLNKMANDTKPIVSRAKCQPSATKLGSQTEMSEMTWSPAVYDTAGMAVCHLREVSHELKRACESDPPSDLPQGAQPADSIRQRLLIRLRRKFRHPICKVGQCLLRLDEAEGPAYGIVLRQSERSMPSQPWIQRKRVGRSRRQR